MKVVLAALDVRHLVRGAERVHADGACALEGRHAERVAALLVVVARQPRPRDEQLAAVPPHGAEVLALVAQVGAQREGAVGCRHAEVVGPVHAKLAQQQLLELAAQEPLEDRPAEGVLVPAQPGALHLDVRLAVEVGALEVAKVGAVELGHQRVEGARPAVLFGGPLALDAAKGAVLVDPAAVGLPAERVLGRHARREGARHAVGVVVHAEAAAGLDGLDERVQVRLRVAQHKGAVADG